MYMCCEGFLSCNNTMHCQFDYVEIVHFPDYVSDVTLENLTKHTRFHFTGTYSSTISQLP